MALAKGSHLGPYEILASLGAGGMGEVYRARDPRLGRDVAIKILPEAVSHDPGRLARFQREARALAALSHPHILDVHDVGSQDGTDYIVTELLEGETLRNHLGRHRLSSREAIGLAVQIARGLAIAHEKGVIHRDLKPANLFRTDEGTVKILDFGLAKLTRPERPAERTAETATAKGDTADGALLGTVDYMSPEQVRGQPVDHRSDVFSFGAVLYEMLAGERPFRGDSVADTVSAILSKQPPELATTPRDTPAPLARIVRRCLEKEPEKRFQSVGDLAIDLEALLEADRPAIGRRWWLLAAGVVVAALAATVGVLQLRTEDAATALDPETTVERPKLVVLPFENLGPPEDAYFASGMTDEIMSRLGRVSGLGVISRTSAFGYDRTGKTVKDIGSDLGVGFVLEGSVRWERRAAGPGRVRISPRLIRVADDTHLWAESYDRQIDSIFAAQSEIAQAVVDQLGVTLLPREREGVEVRPTESPEAYQAYLRGRELLATPDSPREALNLAVQMLERAIGFDPEFVAAHALSSQAHGVMHWMNYDPTPERLAKQHDAARRAVELDPTAPDGHKALGRYYHRGRHDLERALEELTRAAALLPNDSEVARAIGLVVWEQGRLNEALAHFERAFELDPRNVALLDSLAALHRNTRQYPESIRYYDLRILLVPDAVTSHLLKSAVYLDWGLLEEARRALEAAPRTDSTFLVWGWWNLELWDGNHQAALGRLADAPEIFEFPWGRYPTALLRARIYDAMNEPERARASYAAALEIVERILSDTPEDERARRILAQIYAGLGRKEDAIREAKGGMEGERMAAAASWPRDWGLAVVYARVGEPELAIDRLEYQLSVPSLLSYGRLRFSPTLDPLRDGPRFQQLLAQAARDLPPPPSS